jgi:hypothetical protein
MTPDPPIDEIRRIRHEISANCAHDAKRLVAYYQHLQKSYASKIVNLGASETVILNSLPTVNENISSTAPQA